MRERLGCLAIALLVSAAIGGCGTSEQKRAVDARTEVVRFFGVDAPAVVIVNPNLAGETQELAGLPAWDRLKQTIRARLALAGIGSRELRALARPHDEIEDIEAADLAIGLPGPGPLQPQRALLVLATDQTDLLNRLFRANAEQRALLPAGELDGARLYRSPTYGAYAVRDGVLVSAPDVPEVRAAIRRRDGDSDLQLDEDVVKDIFDELRVRGPLVAYANLGAMIDADPALAALASRTPWIGALGHGALTALRIGPAVGVEMVARTDQASLDEDELAAPSEPRQFTLTSSDVADLLSEQPGPDPVRELLTGVTPLSGAATATTDEVRARASVSP